MTEQERNTPVTFRDIEILLQELAKVQGEVFAKTDKRIVEAIDETLDAIIDRLRRITYHQTRNENGVFRFSLSRRFIPVGYCDNQGEIQTVVRGI